MSDDPHTEAIREAIRQGASLDGRDYDLGPWEAALAALATLEARVTRLAELAKTARSQAAAPDYDEEAIREALWALVDAALGVPSPPEPPERDPFTADFHGYMT